VNCSISDLVYRILSKSDDFWLRYGDLTIFKMAAVRHLGFKKMQFLLCCPCRHAVLLPHTKFRWDRTIGQWVMANKAIFKMAAAAILNFKNSRWRPPPSWILKISIFGHVTVIEFNICISVPNFIKIGWFFTEIWWFSDLQNGGRPPSWICYDVTILHSRTHFRCPNIVLKFLVDRCCSFRDTCNKCKKLFYTRVKSTWHI